MPYHGSVKAGFAWSLANAIGHFAGLPYDGLKRIGVEFCGGSILPEVRSILVSRAMSEGATHLLFLDSDMKFPADTITRLLNHGKAVVAANYPRKNIEARPTAYADDDDYIGPVWSGERARGLQKVAYCGFGVMLIDVRVFDELELPFFQFTPAPPDYAKQMGEDVFFCKKLSNIGCDIFIDHDLSKEVAHIGDFEYTNFLSKEAEVVKQKLYAELPA